MYAIVAQSVEHYIGNVEVAGSIPAVSSIPITIGCGVFCFLKRNVKPMQLHCSGSNLLPLTSILHFIQSAEQSSSANQPSFHSASLELFARDLLRNQRFRLGLRRVRPQNFLLIPVAEIQVPQPKA